MSFVNRGLAWAGVFLVMGCSGEPLSSSGADGGVERVPRGAVWETDESQVVRVEVAGVLATAHGAPVVAGEVLLVDSAGQRREDLSDDAGRFAFAGVVPPYDLVVDTREEVRTAYLGLRRPDPYIEVVDEKTAPLPEKIPEKQLVRVQIDAPHCGLDTCWIAVVTSSASGRGTTTAPPTARGRSSVEVEHRWHRAPDSQERIEVHALVTDEEQGAFLHAHAGEIAAAPGEISNVGRVAPERVAATAPIELGAEWSSLELAEWRWQTVASLDWARGAEVPLGVTSAPSVVVPLPLLPRAGVRVHAVATDPHTDERSGFVRLSEAWSGTHPVVLDPTIGAAEASARAGGMPPVVVEAPAPVWPTIGGMVAREAVAFAWKRGAERALATVTVVDRARGTLRLRALTDAESLPATRLGALGLAKLLPGEHVFQLATAPSCSIDDATSPDVSVRRRRFDRSRPGAAAHLRVPFHVGR